MSTSSMHKSLGQLESEAEHNRAALVATVEALREVVLDEVGELRRKVSVDHIKGEIGGYARETGTAWFESLQRGARTNPLLAAAVGAGLGLPVLRLVSHVPGPVLLIGAGVALTRPRVRVAAQEAATNAAGRLSDAKDYLRDTSGGVTERAQRLASDAGETIRTQAEATWSSASAVTKGALASISDRRAAVAASASDAATSASGAVASVARAGSERALASRGAASRSVHDVQLKAVDLFQRNPLVIAGVGLACGALVAALIPSTRSESRLLERVAPDLNERAANLVDQGYEAAAGATAEIYNNALERAKDQGMDVEAVQTASATLERKVDAVVDAALGNQAAEHRGASGNSNA